MIGDFTALDPHRLVLVERDDTQGEEALQKKVYLVDLRHADADGYLQNPLQSVETVEPLGGERLLIANDNNYPSNDGRWIARDRPDDTELIIVRVPSLR